MRTEEEIRKEIKQITEKYNIHQSRYENLIFGDGLNKYNRSEFEQVLKIAEGNRTYFENKKKALEWVLNETKESNND